MRARARLRNARPPNFCPLNRNARPGLRPCASLAPSVRTYQPLLQPQKLPPADVEVQYLGVQEARCVSSCDDLAQLKTQCFLGTQQQ
jgi:hypothetical protein